MAYVTHRANLKAASFPFLSELHGQSIIVKQQDAPGQIGVKAAASEDGGNSGIPQIYYCHNVVPTDSGYKSTGYTKITDGIDTDFVDVITLHNSVGETAHMGITATGDLYVMVHPSMQWIAPLAPPVAATIAGKRMTVGTVSGVSYIYFSTVGCYVFDFATNTMSAAVILWDGTTTVPVTDATCLGLASDRGYLIGYTTDQVVWSSLVNPLDMVGSLATGAGGGKLEKARGTITTIESVYGGIIVFTSGNAVGGVASDNTRFPYIFTELTGAGGLTDPDYVTHDSNSSSVYAYTTAGLQQMTVKQSIVWGPEVTDFLSNGTFEDYDEVTDLFTITNTAPNVILKKRLALVASRYLIISYGITNLTHALYYDISYKQWGRLKLNHVEVFEFWQTSFEVPKKSIAFVSATGEISILNTAINTSGNQSDGVMLIGKFQYVRTRLLTLQRVSFENVNAGNSFRLLDLPSLDGKNFNSAIIGYLHTSNGKHREYLFHNTALNHTLVFKGVFNAVCLLLTFNVASAR